MSFSIDTTSYDKAAHYPQRHGYQLRGGTRPTSIIIHTTSNRRATQFETEANFLFKSAAVSSHFLISKDDRVVQFLDPVRFQAWHAGETLPAFLNARSIGIEHHVSVGETWTQAQHEACTNLVRSLMQSYGILPEMIETHRAVARPKGRKSDPEGWEDVPFYAWRATLVQPAPSPFTRRYRVRRVMISQRPEGGPPYAGELAPGEEITADKWYATYGTVHLQDERGFVLLRDLEAI